MFERAKRWWNWHNQRCSEVLTGFGEPIPCQKLNHKDEHSHISERAHAHWYRIGGGGVAVTRLETFK